VYRIRIARGADRDLHAIRAHERVLILDGIQEMLSHEPTVETRNRKRLVNLVPPFEAIPPVWQLRIRDYRVFYDVSAEEQTVFVRAVRRKLAHRTTEEIL
jgi:mRNA-degrading endonuclease RelE of RelBE toxin-antitoxin system